MIGANDYGNGVSAATFKSNMISEISALDAAISVQHMHVLIHTYPRFASAALAAKVSEWDEFLVALREVQALYPTTVAVINTAVEWAYAGVPGASGADLWSFIEADNIHMNDQGHDLMADILRSKTLGVFVNLVGGTTAPPVSTTRTMVTSDSFSGPANTTMSGKSTDAALGGSALAYQSSAFGGYGIDATNRLVRVAATTEFLALPSVADFEFEFVVAELTSATGTTLNCFDLRRLTIASGSNLLRLRSRADGSLTFSQVFSGAETLLTNGELPAGTLVAGNTLRIKAFGADVTVYINNVAVITTTTNVITGGFVGFTKSSSVTSSGAIDSLKLYSVTA